MSPGTVLRHAALLACTYAGLAWTACSWSVRLYGSDPPRGRGMAPPAAGAARPGPGPDALAAPAQRSGAARADAVVFQRIAPRADAYSVEYGFRNFNRDALTLAVDLPRADVDAAASEFGFSSKDLKDLDLWYRKAQEAAIERSKLLFFSGKVTAATQEELDRKMADIKRRNADIQAGLDRTLADLAAEYRDRRLKLYQSAGFRYKDARTVEVDIAAMVRRNARRVSPASLAFAGIARDRGYGSEDLVGAVTAMVQTAMRYEIPGTREGDRVISGVLPPPKAFVLGQGDCDTKSALVGSILINWPNLKLVGLGIPEHYLVAVHRIPSRGDVYVEHEGLPFVMIEPAGPAWLPPGKVGEFTEHYLDSGKDFTVQPFF